MTQTPPTPLPPLVPAETSTGPGVKHYKVQRVRTSPDDKEKRSDGGRVIESDQSNSETSAPWCEMPPTGPSDTHIIQHIQEGFMVTKEEDT